MAFLRATLSLGTCIGGLLYAGLLLGLDQQYGRIETVKALEDAVLQNGHLAARVESEVGLLKAALIEGQLYDLRIKQCQASGDLRVEIGRRVAELQNRYAQLTDRAVQLPECMAL